MKLGRKSSLADVARTVGRTLKKNRVRAALTGGACAHLYSRGAYASLDVDFVLLADVRGEELDTVMSSLGFSRKQDRYVHPELDYFVEFLPGPLAVGADERLRPIEGRNQERGMLILSATDSCRDRLAAFYHWNDRQSLQAAVAIALHNRVNWSVLQRWSAKEGHDARFEEFRRALEVARRKRARR